MKNIILASASPRRKDLLEQIGISCQVMPSFVEEKITSTKPDDVVQELSAQKCNDVAERIIIQQKEKEVCIVVGADTVVACEGHILGKPEDEKMAEEMLSMLQGNVHQVYTGVTLIQCKAGRIQNRDTFYEKTDVYVEPMTGAEIRDYINTGDPMDKAGAYGIQGCFAKYVGKIQGDYNNVVGLPTAAVYKHIKEMNQKEIIRDVREEELETVAKIEAECFPAAEAAGLSDFKERFRTCVGSFFVAEDTDGSLMGFCNGACSQGTELTDDFYHETTRHDPEGPYQMIFGLDTLPVYQGRGVGSSLMKHMIESARQRGKKAVILTCKEHMIPFYEKIGYEFVEKADSNHGGAVWYKMIYRLK